MPTRRRAGSTSSPTSALTGSAPAAGESPTTSPGRGTSATVGSRSTSKRRAGSSAHDEARDEEARRPVYMRKRLEELGSSRMPELRPLGGECAVHLEARGVDDVLRLLCVDRADRIDERASGTNARRSRAEQLELELRQRHGAPAEVRPAVEHA